MLLIIYVGRYLRAPRDSSENMTFEDLFVHVMCISYEGFTLFAVPSDVFVASVLYFCKPLAKF